MRLKKGIAVSPGIAIAKAYIFDATEYSIRVKQINSDNVTDEISKLEKAIDNSIKELKGTIGHLQKKIAREAVPIIDAHIKILQDNYLKTQIIDQIKRRLFSAEYAVSNTLRKYIKAIVTNEANSFWSNRINDIYDIEKRILRNLREEKKRDINLSKDPMIVISQDLTPSETASLDRTKIKGFAIDKGGRTSHTAIIARAMGIPAVVALNDITLDVTTGDMVIIDGNNGIVITNPDDETIKKYLLLEKNFYVYEKKLLEEIKKMPSETLDGQAIKLYANIEFPQEISTVLQYGAEGIGLFRTEFLYTNSRQLPSEKQHFEAYKKIATSLKGKEIIIRTFDIGGDKIDDSVDAAEKNPFLGCRAIRLSLKNINIFKAQLRGILRASAYGNVSIMFPMISTLEEIKQSKSILEQVKTDLRKERLLFKENVRIGIMVEIPSAAILIDSLIKEVDFCSIGTNDLIQYTLAVDRTNEKMAYLYQSCHPAVLRLIKLVVEQCKKNNKSVSICGEMAGDWLYAILLVGLGLETLSVSPIVIPEIKKIIRSISLDETKKIVNNALTMDSALEIEKYLKGYGKKVTPQLFD